MTADADRAPSRHSLARAHPRPFGFGFVSAPVERWFVYMALCADETIYVGIARDVAARIAAHDAGRGARYTRGRGPLRVLATRRCPTKGDALRLELALKALRRDEKHAVAASKRKLGSVVRALRARTALGSFA